MSKLSELQGDLKRLQGEFNTLVKTVLQNHSPLVRGGIQYRSQKCGKPSCKCATIGTLHNAVFLSTYVNGKKTMTSVDKDDIKSLSCGVENYSTWCTNKNKLETIFTHMLDIMDLIRNELLVNAPPGKRGRKKK